MLFPTISGLENTWWAHKVSFNEEVLSGKTDGPFVFAELTDVVKFNLEA